MGYAGIYLIRRWSGETDQDVASRWVDAQFAPEDRIYGTSPEAVARTHEVDEDFARGVVAIVQSINPRMVATEERAEGDELRWIDLEDGGGPLIVTVDSDVQLKPLKGLGDGPAPEHDWFHMSWTYARAIAGRFDCVAYDSDYDFIYDLSLSEDQALDEFQSGPNVLPNPFREGTDAGT